MKYIKLYERWIDSLKDPVSPGDVFLTTSGEFHICIKIPGSHYSESDYRNTFIDVKYMCVWSGRVNAKYYGTIKEYFEKHPYEIKEIVDLIYENNKDFYNSLVSDPEIKGMIDADQLGLLG